MVILIEHINVRTHQMALDMKKLLDGQAAVEAKLTALAAEIAALKGAPPATDPADQAAVDAVGDKLTADAAQ